MSLPPSLRRALQTRLGTALQGAEAVGGGMINRAARIETQQGVLFVKWKEQAPVGFFEAEADGLRRLAETGAIRVPRVIALHDRSEDEAPSEAEPPPFLVLEWVETRPPDDPAKFARRFGEALAMLHRESAQAASAFGLERDNYIGVLPQSNGWCERWTEFYRERRLLPQIAVARRCNLLPAERERRLMTVIDRLEQRLADLPATPCLIHGDLWSGNFLTVGEEPVLIDPAVSYSDREMELAFIELFGGFPPAFLKTYREVYAPAPGYERRRPLHQLYPLLVHLNHFGETYGPDVDRVCELLAAP